MPKLKEREAARREPREKASLTPRGAKAPAILTTAAEVSKRGVGDNKEKDASTAVEQPNNEEPTKDKPNKEDGNDGGKGGGKGGSGLPYKDEPETPDLRPGQDNIPGRYNGLTMTEAGLLIETNADQPKLTPEDIEDLEWGPAEKDKGWGREFQKCILKYVQKPFQMNFEPDAAALKMRLREDGKGDPSISSSVWQTGNKDPNIAQARACQTCREVSGPTSPTCTPRGGTS